jgi:hypothetical protein
MALFCPPGGMRSKLGKEGESRNGKKRERERKK